MEWKQVSKWIKLVFHVPFSEEHELEVTISMGWVIKLQWYVSVDTHINFKKTQHKPHNLKVNLTTDA